MTSENWSVMNDLEDAFSKISAMDFLLEQLQEAADAEDNLAVVDISTALNAYIAVYTKNYDEKFRVAWNQTVGIPRELPENLLD